MEKWQDRPPTRRAAAKPKGLEAAKWLLHHLRHQIPREDLSPGVPTRNVGEGMLGSAVQPSQADITQDNHTAQRRGQR